MQLREAKWRKHFCIPSKLPKMHERFLSSEVWELQSKCCAQDLDRMPPMCRGNVIQIISRFAATSPYAGYTQGNLYLIFVLGLVFNDEKSIYWAFARTVKRVHHWGPATSPGTPVLPQWVVQYFPHLPHNLAHDMIRFRWLYIMFGQTFTSTTSLLTVWDYCMLSDKHAHSFCAALILHAQDVIPFQRDRCELERSNLIISIKIESETVTAHLVSKAQTLLNELECSRHPRRGKR